MFFFLAIVPWLHAPSDGPRWLQLFPRCAGTLPTTSDTSGVGMPQVHGSYPLTNLNCTSKYKIYPEKYELFCW